MTSQTSRRAWLWPLILALFVVAGMAATVEGSTPALPTLAPDDNLVYLYDHIGAQNLGVVDDWEREFMDWSSDGQSEIVSDPKGIFGKVAKVYVRGYGHGTETSWISASQNSIHGPLNVPADADVIAIPLATVLNSEAGIEIEVHHPGSAQTVMTYASHIFDTQLGVDYIVAFADVSEFQGSTVELTITLRQPDVCAGYACTHDADLYIGDLWFERLPDICTTEADSSHTLYHYYDDPTPHRDAGCADPQPFYFIDVEDGPYNQYGIGEDTYDVTADLPAGAQPLQFKVYYGAKSHGFTFNAHTLSEAEVYAAFPDAQSTYVNIAEPSRWMPINDNPGAVGPHLVDGPNTFSFNVYASHTCDCEERPFDLWARFRVPIGEGELRVNVMPEYYTFVGAENIIWGNCHWDPADTLHTGTYHWDFDDGVTADGAVADSGGWDHAHYIPETHTYAEPGVYTARLTVTADFGGASDTDAVTVRVYDPATLTPAELQEVQVNKAIEDGLRWLYNRQKPQGMWPAYGTTTYYKAGTGEAVLAFENQGHLPGNDFDTDIYAEYLQMALDWLLDELLVQELTDQQYIGNPDTNGNGIGLWVQDPGGHGSRPPYSLPMVMMAFLGSLTPDEVATTGDATYVNGRTYRDIVRDTCDWLAFAQNETGSYRGGWRYSANTSTSDNSVTQWPALGLLEAERRWSITAPVYELVKDELELWLDYSQNDTSGGFGYTSPTDRVNIAKTGAGLIMLTYIGADTSDPRVIAATEYLANTWDVSNADPGWRVKPYGRGSFYGMYGVFKGCKDAKPAVIERLPLPAGTLDWYADFVDYLLNTQSQDGSWPAGEYGDTHLDTMWAILILSPTVVGGPVADAGPDREACVNQPVTFDGTASYHTIELSLVEYLWDFDISDGVDWGSPDASGEIVVYPGYAAPGDYTAALRVKDERGNTDIDTVPVHVEDCGCPPPRTYTTDADFDEGILFNVNHDAPHNDQLQLNQNVKPFPFVWIALSGRGTVAKVNTETGQVLGEYRSAPEGRSRNPSRTTVDYNGNVWVGNRDESSGGKGSVVHIGLQENFQCVDRNGNGVMDTSTGLDDVKPWPNPGGVDGNGGVSSAEDECIIGYLRVNGKNVRTVAVDANNDVWVGGYTNRVHDLIDGDTGTVLKTIYPTCGGYGGLVDRNGVLWSARSLLRYDPASDTDTCLSVSNSYGLGVDSNGNIWNSQFSDNRITKLSPEGTILDTFVTRGYSSRGVAVTTDDNIWVANSNSQSVTRLDNDGNLQATISVGNTPTGVAVDAAGKVWVTNYGSDNAMRIDPVTNAVDLTVALGSNARPYNYSDMTGNVILGTAPQGTWTVIHDSGMTGTPWGTISWHSDEPAGTGITVRVRSAESQADLSGQPWVTVANGVEFTDVPDGRYLQIEVRLTTAEQGISPILYDLTVTPRCGARPMLYIEPESVTTTISGTVTVEIRIRDVTNLYGVQLYLSFDPDLVEVVDAIPGGDVNIEQGDFLQPGAVVYTNFVDNDTGEIEYVQTREGAVPGVDGSGVLARITFHGKGAGTSPVIFTLHKLSDPQSVPIDHDHAHGEIIVEGMGTVNGRVILERRINYPNANAGATVELAGQSQVTGDDGYYSFSNVPAGTHQIKVTHPSYLPSWRNIDVTAGAATNVPDVTLLGGDCNTPQGEIDGLDATTMGLAWDSEPGDAHWNGRADVRDDNVIDVFDFTAVKFNWGQTAPGPWPGASASAGAGWQPIETQGMAVAPAPATRFVISPTMSTVNMGGQAIVEVWVQDVENLYGGGFEIEFDPTVVNVQDANPSQGGVQIESGSWLNRQLEVVNSVDHSYGRIEFFVTQRYPATPKSGSGILARITLTGMEEGNTTLHFNSVQLVDDAADEIAATAEDGSILVSTGHIRYLPIVLRD